MNSTIMKKTFVPFTLLLVVAVMFSFTSVNDKNAVPTTAKIGLEIGDEAPTPVAKPRGRGAVLKAAGMGAGNMAKGYSKGGSADKTGRAMKKTTADAKGRAMKKGK
jgi:hypothetical protein